MDRRDFLKTALVGLAGATLESLKLPGLDLAGEATAALPQRSVLRLTMSECLVEMVDQTRVYMWTFADRAGPRFPGPVITVTEGQRVDIAVLNRLPDNHVFAIPGVVHSGIIRPGQERILKFKAPRAGTYIYLDPNNAPLNRVMGLHGVLVSLPPSGRTPYSNPTQQVTQLFNDLGTHPVFPGHPWMGDTTIWVFSQVDPALNQRVRNRTVTSGAVFARDFEPRYFTINGRSGFFAAHAPDTVVHGPVGRPRLIRNVNVGVWGHSPHTHANHGYLIAVNGQPQDNVFLLDTWTMKPMDRKDVLWPFVKPPDIPEAVWERVEQGMQEEPLPFRYPMHCHQEISQTAAGGNYPHGLMAHIEITGASSGTHHAMNPSAPTSSTPHAH